MSKNSITAAWLEPGSDGGVIDRIAHDAASVRRLIGRMGRPERMRICYEAGPTGYGLARLLVSMGVTCQVIAPSLIPTRSGDRVKTDRRDARRLARLYRAGELVAVRIPTPGEEAIRDLCRARVDLVGDRRGVRQQLTALLLRHGHVYRAGSHWTGKHEQWLAAQTFDQAALQTTFDHYRATLTVRDSQIAVLEADLAVYYDQPPFGDAVARLAAYRGITPMGGLTIVTEVCDFRRFGRAEAFMGFTGLVPSEYSSGGSTTRGRLTKAGNTHLRWQRVESAWAYQHRPAVGATLRRRQEGLPPATIARSWKAQQRLCGRFRHLAAHKHVKGVVAAAVARELAGFVWAEMTATT